MTFKEWMQENRPDRIDDSECAGVIGCPYGVMLESYGKSTANCICNGGKGCEYCWNREMPEAKSEAPDKAEKTQVACTDMGKASDLVNHPGHYTQGGIECIDAMESAVSGLGGIEAVLAGNVIKYVWRFKHKNGVQDLEKAKWYLSRLIRHEKEGSQRENH